MSEVEPTQHEPGRGGRIESWVDFIKGPPGIMAGVMALLALVGTGVTIADAAWARTYWLAVAAATLYLLARGRLGLKLQAAILVGGLLVLLPAVAVFVPEMARRADDPLFVRNRSFVLGLVLVPLTLAWTGAMLLVPDSVGDVILGESWRHAEPLVLLTGLTVAIAMFSTGTVVGIRALQAGRFGFTARVVVSEYVDIAHAFVDREGTGMVNAVIDQLARRFRAGELGPAAPPAHPAKPAS